MAGQAQPCPRYLWASPAGAKLSILHSFLLCWDIVKLPTTSKVPMLQPSCSVDASSIISYNTCREEQMAQHSNKRSLLLTRQARETKLGRPSLADEEQAALEAVFGPSLPSTVPAGAGWLVSRAAQQWKGKAL